MKKATKRLMMVVAILLCLVLISTSVVSGIFAKFIIQKSATTSVGFTNFGMTVNFDSTKLGTAKTTTKTGDSMTYTYDEIILKPGDTTYSEAIKFSISGEAKVQTLITIDVNVVYNLSNFEIPANTFGTQAKKSYMPAGFKVNNEYVSEKVGTDATATSTAPYNSSASNKLSAAIETKLTKLTGFSGFTYSDNKITRTLEPVSANKTTADSINTGDVTIGFDWPATYSTTTNSDEIGTYLSLHNPNMKITTFSVTIKVEQVIPTT